jgi:hypothetical protein
MGKAAYEQNMRDRIKDLGFAIEATRSRMSDGIDNHAKLDLAAHLAELEMRRGQMETKLHELESEPPGNWANVKAEIEQQWNDLMQDFEERVGNLPT